MLGSIRMAKKMNKEEFLSKRYAIDLKIKKLNGEKEQLEKEYIESNQVFPIGSKVCITVMAHKRNNERILVPEAKKLAYIADYDIDDNGEVVPSLRQLDYNGGMSEIPLFVIKRTIKGKTSSHIVVNAAQNKSSNKTNLYFLKYGINLLIKTEFLVVLALFIVSLAFI